MTATVYSTKNCPNYAALKEFLKKEGIEDEFHTGLSPMGRLDGES